MDDEGIIRLFFERQEQAITELDRKYGKVCKKLSNNILNNTQDVEECVNDAYLAAWNAIPPAHPNPLLAYVCKIVRNLSCKYYHAKSAAKRNSAFDLALEEIEDCLSAEGSVEDEVEARELAQVIQQFLDGLSAENRTIFLLRYVYIDSYVDIGKRTGLPEKTISVRLTRLRKQLKSYLAQYNG